MGEPGCTCRHCGGRANPGAAYTKARGICRRCYADPAVRDLYPLKPRPPATRPCPECGRQTSVYGYCRRCSADGPTEEELEALVAERSRPENLPAWWVADERRQAPPPWTVPRVKTLFRWNGGEVRS